MKRFILYTVAALSMFVVSEVQAAGTESLEARRDTTQVESFSPNGMKLNNRFMPTSRRIDREINKNKFIFKGETMLGLAASYGTLTSDEADMYTIFENISLDGAIASVTPLVAFTYRDNHCIGFRLGYTYVNGTLDSFDLNLGSKNDLDIEIPWLNLSSNSYSFGLIHRSYVALDKKGRFGLFGEIEVSCAIGENTFAYTSGDTKRVSQSENLTVKAWFNPGLAVYAMPNVCATLSFGLGGFKYTNIKQYDQEGKRIGTRDFSKMNFKLNIADIRIGLTIHLWNKKKDRSIEQ